MTLMSLVQFPCLAGLSHQESNPEIPETIPGIGCVWWFSRNTLAPPCGAFCSGNRELGRNCPVQLWLYDAFRTKVPSRGCHETGRCFQLRRGWVNEAREILKILGKDFLGFCLNSLSWGQLRLF